jgi:hypothetical protein
LQLDTREASNLIWLATDSDSETWGCHVKSSIGVKRRSLSKLQRTRADIALKAMQFAK